MFIWLIFLWSFPNYVHGTFEKEKRESLSANKIKTVNIFFLMAAAFGSKSNLFTHSTFCAWDQSFPHADKKSKSYNYCMKTLRGKLKNDPAVGENLSSSLFTASTCFPILLNASSTLACCYLLTLSLTLPPTFSAFHTLSLSNLCVFQKTCREKWKITIIIAARHCYAHLPPFSPV